MSQDDLDTLTALVLKYGADQVEDEIAAIADHLEATRGMNDLVEAEKRRIENDPLDITLQINEPEETE